MPTEDFVPASNPFSAGDDFPSTVAAVTHPAGTTEVMCDYPHKVTATHKNIVTTSWSGKEKRAVQQVVRLEISLRFEALTPTDANMLFWHFLAQGGDLSSFTYYDYVSEEAITVRYNMKSMSREQFIYQAENVSLDMIQVL
jgi:hypothetical protein